MLSYLMCKCCIVLAITISVYGHNPHLGPGLDINNCTLYPNRTVALLQQSGKAFSDGSYANNLLKSLHTISVSLMFINFLGSMYLVESLLRYRD